MFAATNRIAAHLVPRALGGSHKVPAGVESAEELLWRATDRFPEKELRTGMSR